MILSLKVKAGSKIAGLHKDPEGKWVLKVRAWAIEGKANEEVIKSLSEILQIPKSAIAIHAGHHNPFKKLNIEGEESMINERLLAALKK